MRKLLAALLLCLITTPALAGMDKPAAIANTIHADVPLGQGTLRRLFLTIYNATLWTDAKEWSMQRPFALSMKYHFNVESGELVDSTVDELQQLHVPDNTLKLYKVQLEKIYPDIQEGDTLTALYLPEKGIRFFHNDRFTGAISDDAFANAFFMIWLSPETSEPSLRRALLGIDRG